MVLSRTVSKINGDFSQKSPFFHISVYLMPLLKGFPLECGIGAGVKELESWGYQIV